MPRLPRVQPVGLAQHVIQRGNNSAACFFAEADYLAYLHWLKESSERCRVAVHAYALMTNHVHLLVTPGETGALAAMMQRLGRHYVHYINKQYGRSGTLWERRYRASLVDAEDYLLELYRYIDLNPVRARMLTHAADYRWSSARAHLGLESGWLTDHELLLQMGGDQAECRQHYRALLSEHPTDERLAAMRDAANTGQALGGERFRDQTETAHGGRVRHRVAGRRAKADGDVSASVQSALEL